MVPDVVQEIATYVGLARDIILLLLLFAILLMVLFIYRKISQTISSVNRIIKNTEEIVSTVSDSIARPAAAGSGVAFGLGKAVAFFRGLRSSRKGGRNDGEQR